MDKSLCSRDIGRNGNIVHIAQTEQIYIVRLVRLRIERVAEEYQQVDLIAGDAGGKLLVAAL